MTEPLRTWDQKVADAYEQGWDEGRADLDAIGDLTIVRLSAEIEELKARPAKADEVLAESKDVIVLLFGTLGLPSPGDVRPVWYQRAVDALASIDRVLDEP